QQVRDGRSAGDQDPARHSPGHRAARAAGAGRDKVLRRSRQAGDREPPREAALVAMSDPPAGLDMAEYEALLRRDFAGFAQLCFHELNPRTEFAMNWHVRVIAAKLAALRDGGIRRLIINLPPRHLKSLLASVAFPAWYLGHQPSAQILCVSYAQDLADKLSRDCRRIVASDWYRRLFPTRLSPQHQAVPEFETTAQGCRVA